MDRRTVALTLFALCLTGCGAGGATTSATRAAPATPRGPRLAPMATSPACGPVRRAWADEVSDTGKVAWQVRLPTDPAQSGIALRPLAIGGEAVFAEFNGVYTLRLRDGHQLWRRTFPVPKADPFAGMVYGLWRWRSAVVVLVGQVSASARLISLNAATGAVRWTLPLSRQGVTGNLTLTGDGGLAMIRGYGTLSVADLTTGRLRWSRTAGHSPGPVAVGTVVAATGNGRAVGYDDRTGAVLWTKRGLPGEPTLAAADGLVLVQNDVTGGGTPTVTALAPRTGRVAWRFDPGVSLDVAGAGPAGIIMASYTPDRVYLVNPATGRPRWSVNTVATYTFPNLELIVTAASVVEVEGRSGVRLVDRRAADGKVAWSAPLGSSTALHLALMPGASGPDVVVTTGPPGTGTASRLRVFRLTSGRLAGATALPTLAQAPLAVTGANTLVQLDDGVCAFPATGTAQTAVGHSSLLDARRDRGAELHCPADRAEALVRLLHRVRQQGPGLVAALAFRKHHAERHGDVRQPVPASVAHLLRADLDGERVRLGPPRREDIDVDRGAAADRHEHQLDRREVGPVAGPDRDLPAALVGHDVPAVGDPRERNLAMRVLSHAFTMPDAPQEPSRACRLRNRPQ